MLRGIFGRGHDADRNVAVGIAGTFDVANYGDLLFPLIAAAALTQRDARIRVVPFSANSKSESDWPFPVQSFDQMTASISTLSAMLIGGGQIIRFDTGYPVPYPADLDLPTGYWLIPAVLAAMIGKPVFWNAVGAWTGSPPAPWHDELVRQVFAASYFIGVRDVASQRHLAKLAPEASIQLLPDTAFSLSRLWPLEKESVEFSNWRKSIGSPTSYIVIQASAAVKNYHSRIKSLLDSRRKINAVILPICWCHGDRADDWPGPLDGTILIRDWPAPGLIREIIARSEFVFASSLHACITAISYGVPGARVPISSDRKYELLDEFDGMAHIDDHDALSGLINRGRGIERRASECADRLDRYWDELVDVALRPPAEHRDFSMAVMLRWVAKACGDRGRFALELAQGGRL
jgi:Polysaccharide pyruvyl transferase